MIDSVADPLFGPGPIEIPLESAPLVGVLFQVRFPEIVSISQKSFIAALQERLRGDFPYLNGDQLQAVQITGQGATVQMTNETVWRFTDKSKAWRLSLSPQFLALETKRYESRKDFVARLKVILAATRDTIDPSIVLRTGMRYIDRVQFTQNNEVANLIRDELRVSAGLSQHALHSVSDVLCETEEGKLLVRWGVLPKGATHDPDMMPPAENKSWFLDLDSFSEHNASPMPFDPDTIAEHADALAARAYSFFRWAVTPDFIEKFGGDAT